MRKENKINYMKIKLLAVSSLIIFGLISLMVYYDSTLLNEIENITGSFFKKVFGNPTMTYSDGIINALMTFLAKYGSATFLSIATIIIGVFLVQKHHKNLAIWFLGVVSTGGVIGILLKKSFQRMRPIEHLIVDSGFSYPSGHAITSTLFFVFILLVFLPQIKNKIIRKNLGTLIFLIWPGILFSRLYFHAHYLGDVLSGIAFSVFWVAISIILYDRFIKC